MGKRKHNGGISFKLYFEEVGNKLKISKEAAHKLAEDKRKDILERHRARQRRDLSGFVLQWRKARDFCSDILHGLINKLP